MWNCACNGLILKVGLRFEGKSSQVRIIITYLPTDCPSQNATRIFIFFKCKAGQQWRDCNWFYLPPSYVLCSEICPVTTISPLLSSYSVLQSLCPLTILHSAPGRESGICSRCLSHRQIFCQQCCFFGSALLSLQLTFHLLELLSPLNEVKHTVWFYSCCLHKGGILTTYVTQRGFVSASVGMVLL